MPKMAVRIQFPLFAPPQLLPQLRRPATEIRFSRWNNANAQKFIRHERTQKEAEDQLRFEKRYDSALTIAHNYNPAPPHRTTYKSTGTPSAPSSPSIPGKASKYSKPPSPKTLHPAFRRRKITPGGDGIQNPASPNFRIDENGVSYEMPEAPFVYQYSYTETPKVKPVKLREPLVSPFGPETMAKPWLGRKPLPASKKKLPEFDSFQLPPPHKKGVKPVQAPGPFIPGSGPKYVRSREEVLGEPLTKEEIEQLIESCKKTTRQLNMGRDGLTHNMLDNIHAHWKRRRVCKIKCKGVCTVDMGNVSRQLEEKTGGKIIYRKGGVIYLFRGRNYNYKSRPRFPLMLWKPTAPVYPRLVRRVPEGLTLEEATDMRKRGRNLTPICKLAKNGMYCDLVKNVREAFEACELVRINCQGLNPTDHKKIGAKLKDLVPSVLISFEREHILIWRGRDWKSSIVPNESLNGLQEVKADAVASELSASPLPSVQNLSATSVVSSHEILSIDESLRSSVTPGPRDIHPDGVNQTVETETLDPLDSHPEGLNQTVETEILGPRGNHPGVNQIVETETLGPRDIHPEGLSQTILTEILGPRDSHPEGVVNQTIENETILDSMVESEKTLENTEIIGSVLNNNGNELKRLNIECTEGIRLLRKEAVESGMAFVLDDSSLDADIVFKEAVAFAKTAPPGPTFRRSRSKKLGVEKNEERECGDSGTKEGAVSIGTEITVPRGRSERKTSRSKKMEDIKGDYINVAPQGSLRVDELAKLLA